MVISFKSQLPIYKPKFIILMLEDAHHIYTDSFLSLKFKLKIVLRVILITIGTKWNKVLTCI